MTVVGEVTNESVGQVIASIDRVEELAIFYDHVAVDAPELMDRLTFGREKYAYVFLHFGGIVSQHLATKFVAQLIANNTLTCLSVGHDILRHPLFPVYLIKANSTLKMLALRSASNCDAVILRPLVTAISTMSALEVLTVDIELNGTQEIAIFAEVVARNRSLRSMSLKQSTALLEHERFACPGRARGNHPETIEAWLSAFKQNSFLQMLTMDFLNFGETDCHAFLRALAQSKSVKQLIVLNLPSRGGLKEIYGTIRECGLGQRVLIENHCLDSTTLLNLSDCLEVTAVVVDTLYQNVDLLPVLDVISSCGHITSLCLRIDREFFDHAVSRPLVQYIARAPKLTELWLNVMGDYELEKRFGRYVAPDGMVKAISSNKNLNAVTLKVMHLTDTDSGMLAEAAVGNPNLYHVEVNGYEETNLQFLRLLAPMLGRSCNLLQVRVPTRGGPYKEEFVVLDHTRRNSSLLIRAARHVMGDATGYCVRALEFVSKHPKLVERVSERADVDRDEAKLMVRGALSGIIDMNGFMRATGVVKDKVECWAKRDSQMQLHDLSAESWWHVRKYLKVVDVLEP